MKKIIKYLKNNPSLRSTITELIKGNKIIDVWSVNDVLFQAVSDDVEINESDAKKILLSISRLMDASVGINWDVISIRIGEYLDEKKSK